MKLCILNRIISSVVISIWMVSCVTSPKTSFNTKHKLPKKQRETIATVYKYMQNNNLIQENTIVSDSLVYTFISDFSKEMYPNIKDFKKFDRIHDSLYNISIKTKNYIEDYSIKEILKNTISEKNAKYKLYFSKLHENYIIAEVFDLKYNYGTTQINRRQYYGISKRYLFIIKKKEIQMIYSKAWEYGI